MDYYRRVWEEGARERSNRLAERLRAEDEERERNHRAWHRLCGSLGPIGRIV